LCHKLLRDSRLPQLLFQIDADLAAQVKQAGCPCGGVLHVANYPRKPRAPAALCAASTQRLSFCCSEDGCRCRQTPPSARFLGRRVYLGVMVTLVSAMCHGLSGARAERLCEEFGVSRWTLQRWRTWWLAILPESKAWKAARGLLSPAVEEGALPCSLTERFLPRGVLGLSNLMRFLAPCSLT